MEKTEIVERVTKVLAEHLGTPLCELAIAVKGNARFSPDPDDKSALHLDADSLDVVELTMAFEEEFGIAVEDDEAERMGRGRLSDAVDLIAAKLGS